MKSMVKARKRSGHRKSVIGGRRMEEGRETQEEWGRGRKKRLDTGRVW